MRLIFKIILIYTSLVKALEASAAEVCASKLSELEQHTELSGLAELFKNQTNVGLVNQTGGSFVRFDINPDKIEITFFTSGLFDLLAVKRSGPVKFCVSEGNVEMKGLNRIEKIQFKDKSLHIGKAEARLIFDPGEMPEKLKKLHNLNSRGLANEQTE